MNRNVKLDPTLRRQLLSNARKMRSRGYAKYSQFKVGAAILGRDGNIYTGCNVENISYGLTICAERVAVFNAVSMGVRRFRAIAISSSGDMPTYPCGACRQVLAEFGNVIVVVDHDPNDRRLSDLLPLAFNRMD